jgi:hypothetical protein
MKLGGHSTEGDLDFLLLIPYFNHPNMADLRTSEVDEKLVPFNMGP